MAETAEHMPDWFDPAKHRHSTAGVMDIATGLSLAGDGLPYSGPIRARRLAERGAATDALGFVSDAAIALQADGLAEEKRLAASDLAASAAGAEEKRLAASDLAASAAGAEEKRLAASDLAGSAKAAKAAPAAAAANEGDA